MRSANGCAGPMRAARGACLAGCILLLSSGTATSETQTISAAPGTNISSSQCSAQGLKGECKCVLSCGSFSPAKACNSVLNYTCSPLYIPLGCFASHSYLSDAEARYLLIWEADLSALRSSWGHVHPGFESPVTCSSCVCCCFTGSSAFINYRPTSDCTCDRKFDSGELKLAAVLAVIVVVPTLLASCYLGGQLWISPYRKTEE